MEGEEKSNTEGKEAQMREGERSQRAKGGRDGRWREVEHTGGRETGRQRATRDRKRER
jgi:hypothetical protein